MWELVAVVLLSVGLGAAGAYYLFGLLHVEPPTIKYVDKPVVIREKVLDVQRVEVPTPVESPQFTHALQVLTKRVEGFRIPPSDVSPLVAQLAELRVTLEAQGKEMARLTTAVDAIPNPQPVNPAVPGAGPQSWKVVYVDTRGHVVGGEARRDRRPVTITREDGVIYAAGQQRPDGVWEYRQVR